MNTQPTQQNPSPIEPYSYKLMIHTEVDGPSYRWRDRQGNVFSQEFSSLTLAEMIHWYETEWRGHFEHGPDLQALLDVEVSDYDCITYMIERWRNLPFNPFGGWSRDSWCSNMKRPRMCYGEGNRRTRPYHVWLAIDFMTFPNYDSMTTEAERYDLDHPAHWTLLDDNARMSPRRLIDGVASYIELSFSDEWSAIQLPGLMTVKQIQYNGERRLSFERTDELCYTYRDIYLHYTEVYRKCLEQIRVWCCG